MLTRKRPAKPAGVRLFQVLRELNVAADTIVDTLRERGFELDAKLAAGDVNARLEPAMYATLVETYSDDAEAKARVRELRAQIAADEAAVRSLPPRRPRRSPSPRRRLRQSPSPRRLHRSPSWRRREPVAEPSPSRAGRGDDGACRRGAGRAGAGRGDSRACCRDARARR